jgi:hypothetical protein
VSFSVHDTGRGISATEVPFSVSLRTLRLALIIYANFKLQIGDVFQPFYAGAKEDEKGIGLGLTIAQSLVEMMGGSKIVVKSTIGQGPVFAFQMPFALASRVEDLASRVESSLEPLVGDALDLKIPQKIVTSSQELAAAHQTEINLIPLQFLVVDDNTFNKTLFERTVKNVFVKQDRVMPVFTLLPSLIHSNHRPGGG